MTGLLKELLNERADSVPPPHIDMAELTRNGDRRVRRRRVAVAGGLAAAAVVAAGVTYAVLPNGDQPGGQTPVAVDGTNAAPLPLSWINGETLYRLGEPDVTLAAPVRAWVWVDSGALAYIDQTSLVHLWNGEDQVIGHASDRGVVDGEVEIVSDSGKVGWQDGQSLTVYDLKTNTVHTLPSEPGEPRPNVSAIDGDTAYGVDGRGVLAWNLRTDTVEIVNDDPTKMVLDAASGTVVHQTSPGEARVSGPGRNISMKVDSIANLSPLGEFVMAESQDVGVLLNTSTGEDLAPKTGFDWALPYQWLDSDTVAVLAFDLNETPSGATGREVGPFLLSCQVGTDQCSEPVKVNQQGYLPPLGINLGTS